MHNPHEKQEYSQPHPIEDEPNRAHNAHAEMTEHGHHMDHASQSEHADSHAHASQMEHEDHSAHVDHTGHEQMFRRKFWVSLALSIPVLVFSPSIQAFLGYSLPAFPGSQWVTPVFAVIVFAYGGVPFLQMAVPELKNRQPGMMTLISLAIIVAFVYSLAALFLPTSVTFFWALDRDAQRAPGVRRLE
jgi:Cu2+-exporting ATPase